MHSFKVCLALLSVTVLMLSSYTYALPDNFMFGMATASYQIEGAWNVSGRGPSIWDVFSHTPGKVANGATGDVADDFYHRYAQDVQQMVKYGITHFRFSISWTRILPTGSATDKVNQKGIDFYNQLIDTLLANGIEPAVTLFHWDSPQGLETAYSSFLSPRIVDDFNAYADICFKAFGDRVKVWFTFNEPHTVATLGYNSGVNAPGRYCILK
jgi:beta-glucosidase